MGMFKHRFVLTYFASNIQRKCLTDVTCGVGVLREISQN